MTDHPPGRGPDDGEPGYLRIGELARRTGASPELLRAWERRYGLLRPTRSPGGFRLYTAADEDRIRLMREYLGAGVAAAEAARLAIADARAGEAQGAPGAGGREAPAPSTAAGGQPSALEAAAGELAAALDRFDEEAANAVLDRVLAGYRVETVLRDLVVPYLHELGERWARGEVSVAQEHFASNLLRGRLLGMARGWGQGRGPVALLACPPGELHDLGLLVFGLALHRRGWRVVYLGPDTPLATVRQAAAEVAPLAVVLAGTVPEPLADQADAVAGLAGQTLVAVGGQGATAELAARTGARLLEEDPVTAAATLDRLVDRPGRPQRRL